MTCDRWANGDNLPSPAEVMTSHAVVLQSCLFCNRLYGNPPLPSPTHTHAHTRPLVPILDSVEVFAGQQEGFYDAIVSGFRALPQTREIHHCKNQMDTTCIHFRRSDRVRNERPRSGKSLEKISETDDKVE